MAVRNVVICAAQIPFARGGAETLVDGLAAALRERDLRVDVVSLPFKWYPKANILRNCLAWRMIDLTEANGVPVDAVICTKFPSYVIQHPRKIVWLIHQFRQVYDLYGTPHSDFTASADDQEMRAAIQTLDARTLAEAERRFAISANVADRLLKYNGLTATPLHPPPLDLTAYRNDGPGDYILSAGRLDALKRVDLLLSSLAEMRSSLRCVIAGEGPAKDELRQLAQRLGVADRVEFAGWVTDEALRDLYANARAVYFAPVDEDYGYITVEAFLSGKPVVTAEDSGGALEFVRDGENGLVCPATVGAVAAALDRLADDPAWAGRLGCAGRDAVRHISWDNTVEALLGGL